MIPLCYDEIVKKNFLVIMFLLVSVPVLVYFSSRIQQLLGKAAPIPANLSIDVTQNNGAITPFWSAFSQGGEEPPPMLTSVVPKMKPLSPQLIRIDHIYDSYSIVQKKDTGYRFDFTVLDKTVDDILNMGALPFFSLSYMPPAFTSSGSVIDTPIRWDDWKLLVQKTIEHYSGKTERNLTGVYYEVWNEPELPQFGSWSLSGDKDYRLLYYYASLGATQVQNVNLFFFGGPAVGSYYSNWVRNFVTYIDQNHLRFDFYSWHRYHKNSEMFANDAKNIQSILHETGHENIPLIISEWGIESDNKPINNTNTAATFTVNALSSMLNLVQHAFTFEVKDGPPGGGGKWGLFTHEKDSPALSPKPRSSVFSILSSLQGDQLTLTGMGSFVKGIASKTKSGKIQLLISNYDYSGENTENVPVTFSHLTPASYLLTIFYPLSNTRSAQEIPSTNGTIKKSILLPANTVAFIELTQLGPIATYVSGKSGQIGDSSLVLSGNGNFILSTPEFRLRPQGLLSFDIEPFWDTPDSFHIFDIPFATDSAQIQRLFLAKQTKQERDVLTFGISSSREDLAFSIPIQWTKNSWHHVKASWNITGLDLSIDESEPVHYSYDLDIRNGDTLTFYPIDAALDNLSVSLGINQTISRRFDGRIDQ